MRIDARNLLDRLGRNDFAYREFEDRFSDLELWPILEALLRDPRLQAMDQAEEPIVATSTEPAPVEIVDTPPPSGEGLSTLFSRYGRTEAAAEKSADRRAVQDVRVMLRHLSDPAQGEV